MKLISIFAVVIRHCLAKKDDNHPRVQADANLISMDVHGNNDYFGPIYTGSNFDFSKVKYDTMSKWTFLVDVSTDSDVPGQYNVSNSASAAPIMKKNDEESVQKIETIDLGSVDIQGKVYTDKFCLYQVGREEKTDASGKLCAKDLEFIVADSITGDLNAEGVLGLAPNNDNRSFMKKLKENGAI
jgi:hypothetical protein